MKNVFEIDNYIEACKFLQDKYDALGYERKDYYHITGADQHLTKTSGIGHGNDGLQYHHIREDVVPSLSDKAIATANPIEYQQAKNMCYCNLLEHAWLHVLITENNTTASDDSDDAITGQGGVKWMLLALNSIMCDPNTSYYSSTDEDGRGCKYNVNNIITDNKDAYYKIINRYCTSAFIRQRLAKSNLELAEELCRFTRRDAENVQNTIKEIMQAARDTKLFDWNVNAFADLENYLKTNRTALVWICTGGGKTTTGLEYLRVHNCKALVLGPTDTVKDSWKENANCDVDTYQTFMRDYRLRDYSKYEVIICDEVHHVDAPRWGEGLQYILDNTSLKVIGLTATPSEEQLNGTDKYFGGRLCNGLDLAEGIERGMIYAFGYVQSIYKMEEVKPDFDKLGQAGTELWGRLNIELNKMPVVKVLTKHMPKEGQRKIIVFCSSIKDIQYAIDTMHEYNPNLEIRDITSKKDGKLIKEAKDWFNKTTNKDVCLVTVGMVNEGAHYEGVNTLVMFRRTRSSTLYLQQLGRVVVTKTKQNPHGIVFDFTNNAESLINSQTFQVYSNNPEEDQDTITKSIKKLKNVIHEKADGKEIIYEDYTNDCAATLKDLQDARDSAVTNKKIYIALGFDLKPKDLLANEFVFDLWKDLKVKEATTKIQRVGFGKKARSQAVADALDTELGIRTSKTVKASDVQKIAQAFKVALRRAYNFGIIDFDDTNACEAIVRNEKALSYQIQAVGFKSVAGFKTALKNLGRTAFILAINF